MPQLSIIIPWYNRPEFGASCVQNAEMLSGEGTELIVANGGGDESFLRSALRAASIEAYRIINIPRRPFNKALSLNIAALASDSACLLFLDCDIIMSPNTMRELHAATSPASFATVAWVTDADKPHNGASQIETKQHLEFSWPDGRSVQTEFHRTRDSDGARGGPGIICMLKRHFLEVQGLNSRLEGWGWEDHDLIIRLIAGAGLQRNCCGEVLHLPHRNTSDAPREAERFQNLRRNMAACQRNYQARRFLGTLREDEVSWQQMQESSTAAAMSAAVAG